ncbi:hypothetical protein DCAR_0623989 [Daucus carota subsp. sativus]|uniref:Uncharacterized protein n=1 Tax=Daucus carota subsp. sativus TaxID=79200 RepID=A0A164VK99_DAUCS|nr:PREDICTED: uncharacterized protein LOC108224937 [Daucus carota subsp. sativus]WOH04579.1 hypothetical protein DCAR_0623989 [Daucus carota subsp. sativus]
MASSYLNIHHFTIPKIPSVTTTLSSVHFLDLCGSTKLSSRTFAKFDKFQGEAPLDNLEENSGSALDSVQQTVQEVDDEEEDDSCLPSDLEGAVRQSSEAAASFVSAGGMRATVELLIPQLQFLDDEGAQAELWQLSRIFVDTLMKETGSQNVKAIFPDAGAAALLKYQWKDAAFKFASLSDRKPVETEDEIIVMLVPDYQMLEYVQKIAYDLSDDSPRPLIMWNPRLVSEEVGIGVNARNIKRYFLSSFTTVYSMRPLASGAVFRCFPGSWKVFYDDKDRFGRYLLAKELESRPNSEDLEIIFGDVDEKTEEGPSLMSQAANVFSSMNRFMRFISK